MNVLNLIHTPYLLEFASKIILGNVNELPYPSEALHCFWKLSKFIDMEVKQWPVIEKEKGCHDFIVLLNNRQQISLHFLSIEGRLVKEQPRYNVYHGCLTATSSPRPIRTTTS